MAMLKQDQDRHNTHFGNTMNEPKNSIQEFIESLDESTIQVMKSGLYVEGEPVFVDDGDTKGYGVVESADHKTDKVKIKMDAGFNHETDADNVGPLIDPEEL